MIKKLNLFSFCSQVLHIPTSRRLAYLISDRLDALHSR